MFICVFPLLDLVLLQMHFPFNHYDHHIGPLASLYCQIEHTLPDSTRKTNEPVCTGGVVGRLCACHTLVRKGFLKCGQEKHPSHSWGHHSSFFFIPSCLKPTCIKSHVSLFQVLSTCHIVHPHWSRFHYKITAPFFAMAFREDQVAAAVNFLTNDRGLKSWIAVPWHCIRMYIPSLARCGGEEFKLAATLWGYVAFREDSEVIHDDLSHLPRFSDK